MNLTEEQIKEIEEMAGLFLSPEAVGINLELDENETEHFVNAVKGNCAGSEADKAYRRGWLSTQVELRKAIKQSALNGSSPSQQMMLNFQKESGL
jgi:hypothetical protein